MNLESRSSVDSIEEISRNLEFESIDFFVRLMSLLGLPRSVGEIYGLLYFTPSALTMDQIASRLEISIGSASQGENSAIPQSCQDHLCTRRPSRSLSC